MKTGCWPIALIGFFLFSSLAGSCSGDSFGSFFAFVIAAALTFLVVKKRFLDAPAAPVLAPIEVVNADDQKV